MDGHTHAAAPAQSLACGRGRLRKNKPTDEWVDSKVTLPQKVCGLTRKQNNSSTNAKRSGQLDSAEEIARGCRRPVVCAIPAPSNPLKHLIGCTRKTKPKDVYIDAEVSVPEHVGIRGPMKRKRENINTITGEQGQVDSARVIAKACRHPIVCALAAPAHPHPRPDAPSRGHPQKDGKASKNRTTITRDREWLNSTKFGYYLEHIWNTFPEEKLRSMAYFEPLMFYSYFKGYGNVIACIKRERMFLKKYVVVPIVLWNHWNLLIFCHLGESLNSKTNTPCMLLLDSLHAVGSTSQLEPIIRRLLNDIYKSEERHETEQQLKTIPFLVPKVPQQNDGSSCGLYVLYYINLFLNNAPENFNMNGYPYFMKEDWFTVEEVQSFRQKLVALPPDPDDATDNSSVDSDYVIECLGPKLPKLDSLPPDSDNATTFGTKDFGDATTFGAEDSDDATIRTEDSDDVTTFGAEDSNDATIRTEDSDDATTSSTDDSDDTTTSRTEDSEDTSTEDSDDDVDSLKTKFPPGQ